MAHRSGRDAAGVRATLRRWRVQMRHSCRQMWALYRNFLDATFLWRALRRRNCGRCHPALALAVTVAVLVVIGYGWSVEWHLAQEQTFVTGAVEKTQALSDGSEVSLSANSVLTVDETGPERMAFQEAGEITYNIKANPTRPFILQTVRATASAIADATLRVAIGSQIEFEVLAGAVKIALRGAKPNAPARWLRQGETLRVPIPGRSSVFASSCRLSANIAA